MVGRGEEQAPKVLSPTHWKCFQMNIMIVLWRLQRDIASCDKKTVRGSCSMSDWQILLITQCAHRSLWCGLALVVKKVSGGLKHQGEEAVKPLQILCLGVRHNRSSRRTWLWQTAISSATAPRLAQRRAAICRAWRGSSLAWNDWCMEGMEPGWLPTVIQATSLAWFVYTNSTGREGNVLERHWATQEST